MYQLVPRAQRNRVRVLVVDSDRLASDPMDVQLRSHVAVTGRAWDWSSALVAYRMHRPDAVLLCVRKEMDEIELIRAFRGISQFRLVVIKNDATSGPSTQRYFALRKGARASHVLAALRSMGVSGI